MEVGIGFLSLPRERGRRVSIERDHFGSTNVNKDPQTPQDCLCIKMFRAFVIACLVAAVSAFAPVARGEFVQNGCDFIEIHRNCGMRNYHAPVGFVIAHRFILPCSLTFLLFRTFLPCSFLSSVASRITVNKMSPADLMTSTDAVAPMAKFSQVRCAVCGEGRALCVAVARPISVLQPFSS